MARDDHLLSSAFSAAGQKNFFCSKNSQKTCSTGNSKDLFLVLPQKSNCIRAVQRLLLRDSLYSLGFAGFTRISNVSSFRNPALLAEGITQFLNERSAAFNPQQDLNSNSIPSVAGADTIYAVVGSPATITCSGYDRVKLNTTGNISDVYSLRWFKDQRSTDFILFTYLDLPPHRIQMPQNEWKDRNISFSIQNQPQVRLPNVTFNDQATYICDLTPASRNTPVISEVSLKVVGKSSESFDSLSAEKVAFRFCKKVPKVCLFQRNFAVAKSIKMTVFGPWVVFV